MDNTTLTAVIPSSADWIRFVFPDGKEITLTPNSLKNTLLKEIENSPLPPLQLYLSKPIPFDPANPGTDYLNAEQYKQRMEYLNKNENCATVTFNHPQKSTGKTF